MPDFRFLSLFGIGIITGSALAIQSVINAVLGKRVGVFGSLLVMTVIGVIFAIVLSVAFPASARMRNLPGKSDWYLYLGAVFGLIIMITPIFLVPKLGTTATLTAVVLGQLVLALILDHFGLFGIPKIEINLARVTGVALLVLGAYLIGR